MSRSSRTGRDMSQLLSDFGHQLPTAEALTPITKEARLFRHAAKRGTLKRCELETMAKAVRSKNQTKSTKAALKKLHALGIIRKPDLRKKPTKSQTGGCKPT